MEACLQACEQLYSKVRRVSSGGRPRQSAHCPADARGLACCRRASPPQRVLSGACAARARGQSVSLAGRARAGRPFERCEACAVCIAAPDSLPVRHARLANDVGKLLCRVREAHPEWAVRQVSSFPSGPQASRVPRKPVLSSRILARCAPPRASNVMPRLARAKRVWKRPHAQRVSCALLLGVSKRPQAPSASWQR